MHGSLHYNIGGYIKLGTYRSSTNVLEGLRNNLQSKLGPNLKIGYHLKAAEVGCSNNTVETMNKAMKKGFLV